MVKNSLPALCIILLLTISYFFDQHSNNLVKKHIQQIITNSLTYKYVIDDNSRQDLTLEDLNQLHNLLVIIDQNELLEMHKGLNINNSMIIYFDFYDPNYKKTDMSFCYDKSSTKLIVDYHGKHYGSFYSILSDQDYQRASNIIKNFYSKYSGWYTY